MNARFADINDSSRAALDRLARGRLVTAVNELH
jgi:hypothetical protein